MPGLIEHLEGYLGPIEVGWSKDSAGGPMPFQVARFGKGAGTGTVTFVTLGLSRWLLRAADTDRGIRHEVLMIVPESMRDGPVPGILQQVGMSALTREKALLRGDVIGPKNAIVARSAMTALYASVPVYLPAGFAQCEEDGYGIAMVWLVPISTYEADYVATHGWNAFEERLTEAAPDLTNPHRQELTNLR